MPEARTRGAAVVPLKDSFRPPALNAAGLMEVVPHETFASEMHRVRLPEQRRTCSSTGSTDYLS